MVVLQLEIMEVTEDEKQMISKMTRLVWEKPFDNISVNVTLFFPGEDDLVDVAEEVMDLASRWHSLGLALRLKSAELDTISTKNHTNPTECLRDMLLAWLQQRYDFKKFGLPSWRMLCQAISNPVGGNNPALARKIAEHHYPVNDVE